MFTAVSDNYSILVGDLFVFKFDIVIQHQPQYMRYHLPFRFGVGELFHIADLLNSFHGRFSKNIPIFIILKQFIQWDNHANPPEYL